MTPIRIILVRMSDPRLFVVSWLATLCFGVALGFAVDQLGFFDVLSLLIAILAALVLVFFLMGFVVHLQRRRVPDEW